MDADERERLRAADRLRRLRAGENPHAVYGCEDEDNPNPIWLAGAAADERLLAADYLSLLDRLAAAETDRERLRKALEQISDYSTLTAHDYDEKYHGDGRTRTEIALLALTPEPT